jgi:phosphatidylinositol alpha-mannosyltransferase
MRIALVSPYDFAFPGGVTNHITHLAQEFEKAGHEVTLIAPSSKPADELNQPNLRVIGRPISIPAAGSVARVTISLRLAKKVKEILQSGDFDVVHLHEPLLPVLPITVLRFSNAINIGTFHASASRNWGYFYGRRLLKRWFSRLHGKIAVSPAAAEFVAGYFPGYYNIIPNGIDYDRFSAPGDRLPEFDDGKLNILFLSRMEKRKGLKYLLRAFVYVKQQFPDARLIVAGAWDPHSRVVESYARALEHSGVRDVHFVGWVPHGDLPLYYRTADIFVAPATGQESFGIVLLEAMAAGTPVVASNIQGFAGVLTHGVEGYLVPPRNEQELALAILKLAANPELRGRMAAAGRAKARDYSWDRIATRVLSYYHRLRSEYQPTPRPRRGLRSSVASLLRYRPI